MQAAHVDVRYLMFVIVNDEKVIKEKAEELAKSITQEFILNQYGLLEDFDLW